MARVVSTTWFEDLGYMNQPIFDVKITRLSLRQLIYVMIFGIFSYLVYSKLAPLFGLSLMYRAMAALGVFTLGMGLFARKGKVFAPEWYLMYFIKTRLLGGKPSFETKGSEESEKEVPERAAGARVMTAPMGEPTRIAGVLYDPSTGKRLSNANYEALMDENPYHTGRTDEDGAYSLVFTPPGSGTYTLTIKPKSHLKAAEKIKISTTSMPETSEGGSGPGMRTVNREALGTEGESGAESAEIEEEEKHIYELFPMNFADLSEEDQDALVNSFRTFLNSLPAGREVKIHAVRTSKEIELGDSTMEPEYFRFFIESGEPLDAKLDSVGFQYQRTTEKPAPEIVREFKDSVAVKGGRNKRTATVCEFGRRMVEGFPGFLYGDIDRLVMKVKRLEQGDAVQKMDKFMRMQQGLVRTGKTSQEEESEARSAQEAVNRLTEGESRLFKTTINIAVGGNTREEMDDNYDRMESTCNGRMVEVSDPMFVQKEALKGNLGKELMTDTVTLGTFFPFVSADVMETPGGVLLGRNRRTGAPVVFDPYVRVNQNLAMIGTSGSGKCVTGDTKIVDPESGALRRIDEMVKSQEGDVLSLSESWGVSEKSVSEFHKNGVKDVYELETRTGREIKATANHPFLTIEGWKHLEELNPGDKIATPREIPVFGDLDVPDHKLRVLAYLLGCGHMKGFNITFTGDKGEIQDFARSVEEFSRSIAKVEERSETEDSFEAWVRGYEIREDADVNLDEVEDRYNIDQFKGKRVWNDEKTEIQRELYEEEGLSLHQIAELFECTRQGVAYRLEKADVLEKGRKKSGVRRWLERLGIYGKLSTEKEIPDMVFRLEKKKLKLFLNTLFSCDGWMCVNADERIQVGYSSSSETLARQVQHLLLRFGIVSTLRERETEKNPNFVVEVSNVLNVRKFVEEIGNFGCEGIEGLNEVLEFKKSNPNLDLLPKNVWNLVREIKERTEKTWVEVGKHLGYENPKGFSSAQYCSPSRKTLMSIAEAWDSDKMMELAESEVFWDEIESIESVGQEDVYDLGVNPAHNFVANDIFAHNSYASKIYLTRLFEKHSNMAFFVIDPENEYTRTCDELDQTTDIIHVSRNAELGLDPLKIFKGSREIATEMLIDLLSISEDESNLLSELRIGVNRANSLEELKDHVNEELEGRIEGILEGATSFLFEGESGEMPERAVIDLKPLHEALRLTESRSGTLHTASLLLFGQIWNKIEELPKEKPKVVVVDEVWLYTGLPASAAFLEQVSRRGRKRNVIFLLASQRPEDVLGSSGAKAALENCATKVIFQQDEAAKDMVGESFGLTQKEVRASTDFSPGQAILKGGDIKAPLKFNASRLEHQRFTTKPGEV